jgi:hypothetical protein
VLNAQAAGAVGVLISNNTPNGIVPLGGDDPTGQVTIPALAISQIDGAALNVPLIIVGGLGTATMQRPGDTTIGVASIVMNESRYNNEIAAFGPTSFNITAEVVLGVDGAGNIRDACDPFTSDVLGKIAVVDRGNCTFETKALNAQQAGAAAILIANNQDTGLIPLGEDPLLDGVFIPTLSIGRRQSIAITNLFGTVVITATLSR